MNYIILLSYGILLSLLVSILPIPWVVKASGIVAVIVALFVVRLTRKDKPVKDMDWFRRTVEETMHIAIDLGFNPSIQQNEAGNGSAVYHCDAEGNLVKLIDLEVPANNSTEADYMTILETNRENLIALAKKLKGEKNAQA